jgi:hypothetical protein
MKLSAHIDRQVSFRAPNAGKKAWQKTSHESLS